jgi:hypothetical protein
LVAVSVSVKVPNPQTSPGQSDSRARLAALAAEASPITPIKAATVVKVRFILSLLVSISTAGRTGENILCS